jgi:Ca-activated chloride channel family protein
MSNTGRTASVKEAMLYVKDENVRVALKDVRVEVEVKDVASHTTVSQVFENKESRAIEAVYCFPIEEGAAVNGFEIETGGRTIKGTAEEREKAFEIYDRAIEAGDASYLLDQEAEDILNISVGNIKPKQEVKVRITYVAELPVTDGTLRLQIPTTVSPRYAPVESDPVKVDRITPPYRLDVPYELALTIRVLSSTISGVASPSHRIKTTEEGEYTVVTLEERTARLDRDFILEINTGQRQKPICLLASNERGDRAALFRFFPELDAIASEGVVKSEIIFVLDCSGSMSGSSIQEAKGALELSLRSLSEGDLFNIIRFGSTYELFSRESLTYNSATLNRAVSYLSGIDADLGGTELSAVMSYICSLPKREGFLRDVLLLTDGEVSNPDEVIRMVSSARERMRVFSFGIGYGASHYLVRGAARAGRGASEMIQPGEKIQPKVLRQFCRMSQPFLTEVSVHFAGAKVELPHSLPPLFEGDSYTLFARVQEAEPDVEVTFAGTYLGKTYSWKAKAREMIQDNAIPCLWALSRIRELKELEYGGSAVGGSNQTNRRRKRIEKEVTDLGLRFNLLTDYTSFVAVEERKEEEKSQEKLAYRRVPVLLTKDWHGIPGQQRMDLLMSGPGSSPPVAPYEVKAPLMKSFRGFIPNIGGAMSDLFRFGGRDRTRKNEMFEAKQSVVYRDAERAGSGRGMRTLGEPEKGEWYLELLGTQQAEGSFTGLEIIAGRLKVKPGDLEELAQRLDVPDRSVCREILLTWLAVRLLSADPDAAGVAGRAIKKAKRWLGKHVPQPDTKLTVEGRPVEEYMKIHYNVEI